MEKNKQTFGQYRSLQPTSRVLRENYASKLYLHVIVFQHVNSFNNVISLEAVDKICKFISFSCKTCKKE